jgi:hypothetical protein
MFSSRVFQYRKYSITRRLPMIPLLEWPLSAPIGAEISSFEDRDLSRF